MVDKMFTGAETYQEIRDKILDILYKDPIMTDLITISNLYVQDDINKNKTINKILDALWDLSDEGYIRFGNAECHANNKPEMSFVLQVFHVTPKFFSDIVHKRNLELERNSLREKMKITRQRHFTDTKEYIKDNIFVIIATIISIISLVIGIIKYL
jgi:hypothetical protein